MDLRYPIGEFKYDEPLTDDLRRRCIADIESAPQHLRDTIANLSDQQLDTSYRPDGWTVRQVVHHVADSHINAYVRFRLALTEDNPTIKTYMEPRWAELPDAKSSPIAPSLTMLEALHQRWILLLNSLSADQCARTIDHPEFGTIKLDMIIAMYAWHGKHHVAHIMSLRDRMGW